MKDGYETTRSREAGRANQRQKMFEAEHHSANSFVKSHEAMTATLGGKDPVLTEKLMDFCSYMSNNGEHAQEFGRKLTTGLDKKAYPVK